jgi:hypothetical protein
MQARNRRGQTFHEPGIQLMPLGKPIEERLLVEPHHLDEPIDRRALPSDRERPASVTRDGSHSKVERGRRAAIEAYLRLAGSPPQLNRRKINIVESNGTFELVNPVARQPDDADVRVDALDST